MSRLQLRAGVSLTSEQTTALLAWCAELTESGEKEYADHLFCCYWFDRRKKGDRAAGYWIGH